MSSQDNPDAQFRLDGKVSVVTGGGSGIGRAIALRFAAAGSTVNILDLNLADAAATARLIEQNGGHASAFACDVTDLSNVQKTFAGIFDKGRVEILVNNAGVSHVGNVESTTEADFDRILRVNVKGYFHCIQASVGHMTANGGGVILNLASIAATALDIFRVTKVSPRIGLS